MVSISSNYLKTNCQEIKSYGCMHVIVVCSGCSNCEVLILFTDTKDFNPVRYHGTTHTYLYSILARYERK